LCTLLSDGQMAYGTLLADEHAAGNPVPTGPIEYLLTHGPVFILTA